ncbi:orotidine-5'-phosphate decarboxylase [Alloscardovia theropitheci]|uniref:Orotidine 5'-phosphate decarboxylase n=1 Tax=Alloscardovia theropitheci TaxID=2496842 RepID=A0A4R0QQY7_9BIFI|nr:orotidine-5'-phosphate decarboxylase [Alloscardovia theropitheci]TCD54753.1 orotidine-5'-phosphate decarboxylase [Alloscardovia theropitheci]
MRQLIEAITRTSNPSVVGLDPKPSLLPKILLRNAKSPQDVAQAYFSFNTAIIDAVYDIVPAVKPQIAMYESWGEAGINAYTRTNEYARSRGLYVLGDIKRGDIGSTAQAYASHLNGTPKIEGMEPVDVWHEDAVTVNPYLGIDGIEPFIEAAQECDKDIFVLAKTSNPSSADLQDLTIANTNLTLSEHVALLLEQWGETTRDSQYGYSRVGAVVGATHPVIGAKLRELMPHTFFLVPGYGAQGGTARDLRGLFDSNGMGALVNSSRGIIAAWQKAEDIPEFSSTEQALDFVAHYAREAALAMKNDITNALS